MNDLINYWEVKEYPLMITDKATHEKPENQGLFNPIHSLPITVPIL